MTNDAEQVIDLALAGAAIGDEAPRSRAVLGALAVVAALAAAVLLLVPSGDAEVAVDEDATTTTTTTEPDADRRDDPSVPDAFPAPLALGAPDDGKASIGLPVKAEPATGLVDGQTVQVTGTGFPPGESVGVVMCTREAGQDHGARGVDACNIGRFAQTTADADGVATVGFEVRRLVVLDGQEIDCASEAQRCLIGMGMLSDYDQSGGVLVDFDPSAPLPDPPTAALVGDGPFDDGEAVTVRVDGLRPGTGVGAAVCTADGGFCTDAPSNGIVGDDGTATFQVRLWRVFSAPVWDAATTGQDIDCAAVACRLQVWGDAVAGRAVPMIDLSFTDGPIDRDRPVLEVRSEGPYRPGDHVEVFVPDVGPNSGLELMLCGPTACNGAMVELDWVFGGIQARLIVPTALEGNPCIGEPCRLAAQVWTEPAPDAPPPLAPLPVEIVIEA
ncbi:MAG TPA: hypothetical protein DCS55_10975 [Acidimicrobiaceae bacterium]|nr:hypothetical protein [Acidimicrobiaceae bacterium]